MWVPLGDSQGVGSTVFLWRGSREDSLPSPSKLLGYAHLSPTFPSTIYNISPVDSLLSDTNAPFSHYG